MLHVVRQEIATSVVNQVYGNNLDSALFKIANDNMNIINKYIL